MAEYELDLYRELAKLRAGIDRTCRVLRALAAVLQVDRVSGLGSFSVEEHLELEDEVAAEVSRLLQLRRRERDIASGAALPKP